MNVISSMYEESNWNYKVPTQVQESANNLKVGRYLQNTDKSGLQFLPGMTECISDYYLFKNIYCLSNKETPF